MRRNFLKSSALTLAAAMFGGVGNSMAQTTSLSCVPPAPVAPPSVAPVAVSPIAPPVATSATSINVVQAIQALRIPSGPYLGAYEIAPNGLMNWYFANLGLISVVQYLDAPALDKYIRVYLDLYLSKLEPNLSIRDVDFPFGRANTSSFTLVMSDSDDSYAATLLSLTARYLRGSQNWAWWDKNKARLKDIAYRNIAVSVKANGLTSVFQSPRSQTNNAGYLMDNVEVYCGLRDFTSLLKERGDTADAAYYDQFAKNMAAAMATLFSPGSSAFRFADLAGHPFCIFVAPA